ncbi:malonate-semialdehyde dehydrogenase 1-like [Schistocerca gregaria]|uniref:malonate-semialdehyde dehydrogenase 1-like n=1 Tax=Schistocerca gregaria TaxID=7010 RepID=UPI00211EA8F2|nr:malonate-semialdehyde dehydrogenase 1-like [Schistocerca gregaria]
MELTKVDNWIGGCFVPPKSKEYLSLGCPHSGVIFGSVALSNGEDVEVAVLCAKKVQVSWMERTTKARAEVLFKMRELVGANQQRLVMCIANEHGKTPFEAEAEVLKSIEILGYACSAPQLISGKIQAVSKGVTCFERRDPVGIVASIVPFNFPMMVPFWTVPLALVTGNCVILKPSEKAPQTMKLVAEIFKKAGVPDGVFQIVNGSKNAVEAICDHPDITLVTFVGTSRVAEMVTHRCRLLNKHVLALGGAKNFLVAAQDCHVELTSSNVVSSFTGCTGQRCMAASALIIIGDQAQLLDLIVRKASMLRPKNKQDGVYDKDAIGPVIDGASKHKIISYIDQAEQNGSQILLDGREWYKASITSEYGEGGYWVGPTVILHASSDEPAIQEEIFGPVLSVVKVSTFEEAISIQKSSIYGNAACIYTSSGEVAEWFASRFEAGMIGINVGVPVPSEPFSFGGMKMSKFGELDITGEQAIDLFTVKKKISVRWSQ